MTVNIVKAIKSFKTNLKIEEALSYTEVSHRTSGSKAKCLEYNRSDALAKQELMCIKKYCFLILYLIYGNARFEYRTA